jgi:hypothetical protein
VQEIFKTDWTTGCERQTRFCNNLKDGCVRVPVVCVCVCVGVVDHGTNFCDKEFVGGNWFMGKDGKLSLGCVELSQVEASKSNTKKNIGMHGLKL